MKKNSTPERKGLKRREFISRTITVGGVVLLGVSAAPANALIRSLSSTQTIRPVNPVLSDFTHLIGQGFRLQAKDGRKLHAKLIEAEAFKPQQAFRFRPKPFSLVFDLPGDINSDQDIYLVSHPRIGSMKILMVPVDLPTKSNRLEAVFA